jgi:hypothetical protein
VPSPSSLKVVYSQIPDRKNPQQLHLVNSFVLGNRSALVDDEEEEKDEEV